MLAEMIIIFVLLFIIFGLIYQFMFSIWIETLIISIVFFVSYVTIKILIHRHKKKKEGLDIASPEIESKKPSFDEKSDDSTMKTLKPFITKNTKEGFKPQTIKEALQKQGWPKEKIDQAFKELKL
ncbi:hypothetical protein J4467_02805 [Candidatus Woesearchaeota archaeon]|nr:hypothetical protein [Candidatus Woesearchaeota archaeon]